MTADLVLNDGDGLLSKLAPLSNLPLPPVVGVWTGVFVAVAERKSVVAAAWLAVGVPARDIARENRDEIVDEADGVVPATAAEGEECCWTEDDGSTY